MNIGIDLGTTNSLVSAWSNGKATLIPNALGEYLTPSVVGVDDDGTIIVGSAAKQRLLSHPDKTVANFKRAMGTDKVFQLGKNKYHAEDLSALVLRQLKQDAQACLGEQVTEAIISVPAYFSDTQRSKTKMAGVLAEFKVDRIINEPTAAALAYGLHERDQETRLMVFDLGGGTFDVSIVEMYDGVIEILSSTGNNHLGGEDFTNLLVAKFISKFSAIENLRSSAKQRQLLALIKKKSERAKQQLTKQGVASISIDYEDHNYCYEITTDEFLQMSEHLLLDIKNPVQRAINDSRLNLEDIDNVILVGGATRMPIIKKFVTTLFKKLPLSHIDPDHAVALGTAIQAGLKRRDSALDEMVVTDVCPYTLGTGVLENTQGSDVMTYLPIIERNTVIPVSRVKAVSTSYDNQRMVKLPVYQGEYLKPEQNIKLGELRVATPKAEAGKIEIDIRYTYDINGLLEVEATVLSTGKKDNLVIQGANSKLTEDEIEKRLKQLSHLKIHPRDFTENRALLARLEALHIESIEDMREYVRGLFVEFSAILDKQDKRIIEEYKKTLKEKIKHIESELNIF
jgi:molecular chaperone HscC